MSSTQGRWGFHMDAQCGLLKLTTLEFTIEVTMYLHMLFVL